MNLTFEEFQGEIFRILTDLAPVRVPPPYGGVGKKGTNMYSPYPGNLQQNGVCLTSKGAKLDVDRVGYIIYADKRSKSPNFIERANEQFCQELKNIGGIFE